MESSKNNQEINQIMYSKSTIKRLVSDIKNLKKNPLDEQGIFYNHDDTNLLQGYALIIGPEDTPYSFGNYFFEFKFPNDYPHSPPSVIFHNWGDNVRFNPNLYRTGKVCLSILNTWKGEGWTSCQTITSVLLTLCTVLNKDPLLNEPGITTLNHSEQIDNYNKIIEFKNIQLSICNLVNDILIEQDKLLPEKFKQFKEIVISKFLENKDKIKKKIEDFSIENNGVVKCIHYNLMYQIDYSFIKKKFINTCELIIDIKKK